MPNDDREKLFERALARHLRHAPSNAACPDAEILAAYHERTLSLEEAAHWKLHIVGCSRCQEVLSLLEETEAVGTNEWKEKNAAALAEEFTASRVTRASAGPVFAKEQNALADPAPTAVSARKKPVPFRSWRWIAPLGAVAAALLVWVGMRETRMAHKPATIEVAQSQQQEWQFPASRGEAPKPPERAEPSSSRSDLADKKGISKDETGSVRAKQVPSAGKQVTPRAAGTSAQTQELSAASNLDAFQQKNLQERDATKSAAAQREQSTSADALTPRKITPAAPPAGPTPAASGGVLAGNLPEHARKKETAPSTSESVGVNGAVSAVTTNSSELKMPTRMYSALDRLSAHDRSVIAAPGKNRAWRAGAAGKIEITADGGKTWKPQQSPVAIDLTSGSAPSDKVCWIAGKAGTLLLTKDGGEHWELVTSPITDDLGGVHAVDAQHASIWDLPNRRSFETADGGATWEQSDNE